MRKSGILLAVSSLPSPYGIGTFSKEAYDFVDFLKQAGQRLWQILPLGPTGYGDSPYQSFSTFAGNPYYIDLTALIREGYLTRQDCEEADWGEDPGYVDYEKIYRSRFRILKKAYRAAKKAGLTEGAEYQAFLAKNAHWLPDYALYMAVKDHFGGRSWAEWEEGIRLRRPKALKAYRERFQEETDFYCFQQYLFFTQWQALKAYANAQGIEIVGDIPIYVAFDSADTWAGPELFQLDENNLPTGVAGCPPDAFCEYGQLWGNPLYRWEYHKETGYQWWIRRIAHCFELYDIVRIDHFRGFDEYWSVPYGDETAVNGRWVKGPGYELFRAIRESLGKKKVIAEDLGFLTDSVVRLVKKTGYPGMKILQFAFDGSADNEYLPHNLYENCIVYTGTHDNETVMGWYRGLDRAARRQVKEYLGITGRKNVNWALIRAALSSVAQTAVIPLQDYLGLGNEARFNTPSTLGGNWQWRMSGRDCTPQLAERIYQMTERYGRL